MEGFSLNVQDKKEIVAEVVEIVKVPEATTAVICSQVKKNVDLLMQMDLTNMKDREGLANMVDNLGRAPMERSSNKNSIMRQSMHSLGLRGADGGVVAKGLMDLSVEMQHLDPSMLGDLKRTFLRNPVAQYFAKFQKADKVIQGIVENLEKGAQQLRDDSKTLQIEYDKVSNDTKQLFMDIEMGRQIDAALTEAISACLESERVEFLESEVLFPIRKKIGSLQTLAVVNQQGMATMLVIVRTNRDLIRGVEEAKAVTVRALETAVTMALALNNQRLVINALNTLKATTEQFILKTAQMMNSNATEIARIASEPLIAVNTLKESWKLIDDTIETINTYRRNALAPMASTIEDLQGMMSSGAESLEKLSSGTRVTDEFLSQFS